MRSERALTLTLAEMYVRGVSTRKVSAIVEQLCGSSISSTQVSQAAALLLARGENPEEHRKVLGASISLSEQEVHWRTFLESLAKRRLRGVKLIISDDHAGLKAARQAVFGGLPWQRCQFYLLPATGNGSAQQIAIKNLPFFTENINDHSE